MSHFNSCYTLIEKDVVGVVMPLTSPRTSSNDRQLALMAPGPWLILHLVCILSSEYSTTSLNWAESVKVFPQFHRKTYIAIAGSDEQTPYLQDDILVFAYAQDIIPIGKHIWLHCRCRFKEPSIPNTLKGDTLFKVRNLNTLDP